MRVSLFGTQTHCAKAGGSQLKQHVATDRVTWNRLAVRYDETETASATAAVSVSASEPKAAAFNFNLATGSGSGIVAAYLTRRCFLEIYLAS